MTTTDAAALVATHDFTEPVFVLGAGFSKAINRRMPLMKDITRELLLRRVAHTPEDRALLRALGAEGWLSLLASEQPFMSDSDNIERQRTFHNALRATVDIVTEACATVLDETPWQREPWIDTLVKWWLTHPTSAVLTLNYDILVEAAVAADYGSGKGSGTIWQANIDPAFIPTSGGEQIATTAPFMRAPPFFKLYKLHGSIHWRWAGPRDWTGDTIERLALSENDGKPVTRGTGAMFRDIPRREPFIVPPTSGKSAYFTNRFTTELWRSAHQRVSDASVVVCIGYSAPETDETMRGLLVSAIGDKPVLVVDLSPTVKM